MCKEKYLRGPCGHSKLDTIKKCRAAERRGTGPGTLCEPVREKYKKVDRCPIPNQCPWASKTRYRCCQCRTETKKPGCPGCGHTCCWACYSTW